MMGNPPFYWLLPIIENAWDQGFSFTTDYQWFTTDC